MKSTRNTPHKILQIIRSPPNLKKERERIPRKLKVADAPAFCTTPIKASTQKSSVAPKDHRIPFFIILVFY